MVNEQKQMQKQIEQNTNKITKVIMLFLERKYFFATKFLFYQQIIFPKSKK